MKSKKINLRLLASLLIVMLVVLSSTIPLNAQVSAPNRFLQISDPTVNQSNVNYVLGFDIDGAGYNVGSINLRFCSNSPLTALPCTPTPGIDVSAATVLSQTGITGFSVSPGATVNELTLTRTASFIGPTSIRIELGGITNPSGEGTSYGRMRVFASEDASGPSNVEGGLTISMNDSIGLSSEVPPYLTLCVALNLPGYLCAGSSGNFIDFGEFSTSATRTATSQFLVATNADDGFVVYVYGKTLTSGNNIIPGMNSSGPSIIGSSQFGLNLRNNSNPNVGSDPVGIGSGVIQNDYNSIDSFKFVSGDVLVASDTVTLDRKFTVSYIANIDSNQSPGIYSTTLLYTALATF